MRPFQFGLDGLLRVRRIREDKEVLGLTEVRNRLSTMSRELDALERERSEEFDEIRRLGEGRVDTEQLLAHRRYLNMLYNRSIGIQQERHRVFGELREAQRKVESAVRDRQVVDRLRERRKAEYRTRVEREE